MKVKLTEPKYITRSFPTNGVLRCLSGQIPAGKSEKDIQDTADILTTIQKIFKYTDNDFKELVKSNNFLGAFILPIGAGKYLEGANPLLKPIKTRLMTAPDINTEIEKMVKEIGENIDLKA